MLLEQEKKVLENYKLVHYVVRKFGYSQSSQDYDDLVSEGMIGLIKAAQSFDESRNTKFVTFATLCIENQIKMYFRRNNKHNDVIYYEESIGDEISMVDIIEDPDWNFTEKIEYEEEYVQMIYYVLNYLNQTQKCCMLYKIAGNKQHEIGKKMGITQSYVARVINKSIEKIKKVVNNKCIFKEEFSMNSFGKVYNISFTPKDSKKFKDFLTKFLLEITEPFEEIPNFKLTCNNNRCTIRLIASANSINFLARLIQEMGDFELTLISELRNRIEEEPENNQEIIKKSDNPVPKLNSNTNSKEIRQYILSMDCEFFEVSSIIKKFSGLNEWTIRNCIVAMKKEGVIKTIDRGLYAIVKKN